MIVSNKSGVGIEQVVQTPTRLSIQKYPWYALAIVSTSLQLPGKLAFGRAHENLNPTIASNIDYWSSGTRLSNASTATADVETVSQNNQYEASNYDINIRPRYTREFKIKVRALRINKAIPKIFLD